MKKKSVQKGFTLVELLVVIAIVAILATVTVIGYISFIKRAAISNDTVLSNQINSVLKGHRVYETVDDENSIAKILKNSGIPTDVNIATEKYDMNIYYNNASNKFELMSNSDANGFKNLHYYLNLVISDENINNPEVDTPTNPDVDSPVEPDDDTNLVTFEIKNTYFKNFYDLEITGFDGNKETLIAKFENGALYLNIYIDESGIIRTPEIDLSEIIKAHNNIEDLSVTFELDDTAADIVENILHDNGMDYDLQGSILKVYTPGKYKIKYSCQDQEAYIDLFVKNVCWLQTPEISVSEVKYNTNVTSNDDGTSNITIKISNIIYNVTITDYNLNTDTSQSINRQSTELSENKSYMDSMVIIIEIGNTTKYISMNKNKTSYSDILNNIDLSIYNTITITYRYQGINGSYCYSDEQIVTIK